MSVTYGNPVIAATRALRFSDHVTKRNGGFGDENAYNHGELTAPKQCVFLRFSKSFYSILLVLHVKLIIIAEILISQHDKNH